ncbi:MAG TPA: Zn-ribbon domain-containing OB-fold protein [Actinomycetota bacterium]|nr:Zn-ribbon domain-containing OB-fold protein [Actinomycetota bacterium]
MPGLAVRRWPGEFPFAYRYTAGVAGWRFLEALRDRGVFLGSRCDTCDYVYVPARLFCERCFAELAADTEVGPAGTLESLAIGHVGVDGEPLEEPVAVGLVRLDGADAVLFHRLIGDGFEIGMRVEAVLGSEPTGSILDVAGFRKES